MSKREVESWVLQLNFSRSSWLFKFSMTFGLAVKIPCFSIFFLPETVQQTQTLVSTKMRAVRAVELVLLILRCPCFVCLWASSAGRSGGGARKGSRVCNCVCGIWIYALNFFDAKCWLAEMTLVMTSLPLARVFQCLLHSSSFPLHADWRKSDSSVDRDPQGI